MKGSSFVFYLLLVLLLAVAVKFIKNLDGTFFQGATFGFVSCITLEILTALIYLRWRIVKKHGTSKITVKMATLELSTMFSEESEEEIVDRFRNRSFFINKFSNEKKLMSSVYRRDETYNFNASKKTPSQSLNKTQEETLQLGAARNNNSNNNTRQGDKSGLNGTSSVHSVPKSNTKDSQKLQLTQSPPSGQAATAAAADNGNAKDNIQEKKKHILEEIEALVFEKVGKKIYLNKINSFRRFLEVFINLEKNFAKELRGIGKPRFLKTCMFDVVVKRDERYHHSFRLNAIETQFKVDYLQIIQLSESKSNSFDSLMIILPNWLYIKNLFLEVSRIRDQLVQYIQFGIFDLSKVLIEEYEETYKKLKVLKTEAQELIEKKMEEAKAQDKTYQEISKRIKDLAVVYEKQHSMSGEKELARKRVELKGEIELLLYDKNNSKIKLSAAYEALHKARQEANKVNAKIAQHKKNWEKRFQTLYKTSMKSIISGFFEMSKDIVKNLKSILVSNLKQSAVQPTIAFDLQSFRDDASSAYSSVNGSDSSSRRNYFNQSGLNTNGSFGSQVHNQHANVQSRSQHQSKLINQSQFAINPSLICADHRQQLVDFARNMEKFEREYDEMTKYEAEVTILIEDIVTSVSGYLVELETKISKVKYFTSLGDSLIYEQLGTCIQVDITNALKHYMKDLITMVSQHLKPFQMATQRSVANFAVELKKLRANVIVIQDMQTSLDRVSANIAQGKDTVNGFSQKYEVIKQKLDATYGQLYTIKTEAENIIKAHEKAVEDYKRHIVNALVVFANQSGEKLEIIENNSDSLLAAAEEEDDNSQINDDYDIDSNHSQASSSKGPMMMKRQSTFFAGNEFLHHYNEDEMHGGGGGGSGGGDASAIAAANDPHNRKAALIVTKLLKIFYRQWKDADYFKEKIKKELYISLNKKLEDSLEEMVVTKLIIKGDGPDIKSIVQQKSEDNEFLLDLEISYKGTIYLEVETAYHIDWPKPDSYKLPLTVKIKLNEFYSILRVCYVPRVFGKSWFSFIGEPVLSLEIDPIISKKYQVSRIPRVQTLIQEIISQKIKKMTFPNRDSIKIPLSKADKEISAIREKLLHKKQTIVQSTTNPSPIPSKSNIHMNPYKQD